MIVADVVLLLLFVFCLGKLSRSLSQSPGIIPVFTLASLLGIAQVIGFGSLLLVFDNYAIPVLLACCASASLLAWLAAKRFGEAAPALDVPPQKDLALLLGLALVAAVIATPAYQITAMGSDAGVYVNRTIQLATDGALFPAIGVDLDKFPAPLRQRYLDDNFASPSVLVDGAKIHAGGALAIEFHALPGWPLLLSASAHFLGIENAQAITALILLTFGALAYLVLLEVTKRSMISAVVAIALMGLPISVYFSRYPTVELLLAMLCTGVAYLLVSGIRFSGLIAGLLTGVYALVHFSGFILMLVASVFAVLLIPSLDAGKRRQLSVFLLVAGASQFAAIWYVSVVSNGYMSDLMTMAFGSKQSGLAVVCGLALLVIALSIMCYPRAKVSDAH